MNPKDVTLSNLATALDYAENAGFRDYGVEQVLMHSSMMVVEDDSEITREPVIIDGDVSDLPVLVLNERVYPLQIVPRRLLALSSFAGSEYTVSWKGYGVSVRTYIPTGFSVVSPWPGR